MNFSIHPVILVTYVEYQELVEYVVEYLISFLYCKKLEATLS